MPRLVPLDAVPADLRGGAVAIGNFDGVHRGHQAVLGAALDAGRPAVALTFEPHPRDVFGRGPVQRLTPPEAKAEVVHALGLDALVVAPFDRTFAAQSAEEFVERTLAGVLHARTIAVGNDFNFGRGRSGNAAALAVLGTRHGFTVREVDGVADATGPVSSSRIRDYLAAGEVEAAAALLGYRPRVAAEVIHGEKRGRTLGYPTANQALDAVTPLRHGIYAVRVRIDGAWHDGVASYGRRPTFDNGQALLETFVFDWTGTLYGRTLPVAFVRYLRPELRFDSTDALIAQMHADSAAARTALAALEPLSPLDAALDAQV